MILTTNRVSDCDPAFESRIHVSLHYPDLSFPARQSIWREFIKKAQKEEASPTPITEAQIDVIAAHALNGRQIKNLVASARSLAREAEENVSMEHISVVLEVMSAWNTVP